MYVLHDLFEQLIDKPLTLQTMLFSGNQGSGSLSDFSQRHSGEKKDSYPAFSGVGAHAYPLNNSAIGCYHG